MSKEISSALLWGFASPRSLVRRLVSSEPWFARNPEDGSNGSWTMREGTAREAVLAARRTSLLEAQAQLRTPVRMRRGPVPVHWVDAPSPGNRPLL